VALYVSDAVSANQRSADFPCQTRTVLDAIDRPRLERRGWSRPQTPTSTETWSLPPGHPVGPGRSTPKSQEGIEDRGGTSSTSVRDTPDTYREDVDADSKLCRGLCGLELPLAAFGYGHSLDWDIQHGIDRQGPDGKSPMCLPCENHARQARRWGITAEHAQELSAVDACDICGATEPRGRGVFEHDHDRSCCTIPPACGECLREMLCHPCNVLLARNGDDPERLRRRAAAGGTDAQVSRWLAAASYLGRYAKRRAS